MPSVETHGTDPTKSRDQLQDTVVYDALQAVPRPFHLFHLELFLVSLAAEVVHEK